MKETDTIAPETKLWDDRFKKGVAIGSVLMVIFFFINYKLELSFPNAPILFILSVIIAGAVAGRCRK